MKNLYGPGLSDQLSDELRGQNLASVPTDPEDYPVLGLKKKKQSSILKEILKNGGYGDLAKMVSIKRQ